MLSRSPGPVSSSKIADSSLVTGSDSPVNKASSVSKLMDSISLVIALVSAQNPFQDDGAEHKNLPNIRRHSIPNFQFHQISYGQFGGWDIEITAVPNNVRCRR